MSRFEERFWAKTKPGPGGCILWTGRLDKDGYGIAWKDGKNRRAHRVAYEIAIGPIPEGKEIDHVWVRGCTSKACVNPMHLEAVTTRENGLRSNSVSGINARKTHCPNGHEYSPANTTVAGGRRRCRTCARANSQRYRAAHPEKVKEQLRASYRRSRDRQIAYSRTYHAEHRDEVLAKMQARRRAKATA